MKQATTYLDDMATIDASELGKLIGRSTKTIKIDVSRRPETLPPRFIVPGTRKVMWRVVDVREWMQAIADAEHDRRAAAAEAARRTNTKVVAPKPFHLGKKAIGKAATQRLKEKK